MESSIRERAICSRCNGKGVIKFDPKPGRWFTKMRLTYQPDVWFVSEPMPNDEYRDQVSYAGKVTDRCLPGWDGTGEELAEEYNEKLRHDLSGKESCSRCFGVGTIPAPLEDNELIYDRGELMAEAFAAGGYQGWYDMQDEWREYRSQTGSHADPLQRQIEATWAREHTPYQCPYEY
jgi:hypothetical protein